MSSCPESVASIRLSGEEAGSSSYVANLATVSCLARSLDGRRPEGFIFGHDVSVMGSAPTVSTKPGCVVFILKQEESDQNISAYFRPKVTEL